MAKLFVVGFPKDMEEIELVEIFSIHGTVNTVTIVTDIETGISKGYGFVTMTDDTGAERAIAALDGASIDDRKINVRIADDSSRDKPVNKKEFQKSNHPENTVPVKKKRPRRKS